MRLNSMKHVLEKAKRGKYAVGQFNFYNIESAVAIINAAKKLRSPVILGATEKAIEYGGLENLVCIVKNLAKDAKIPVVLHLDHGTDEKLIRKCVRKGFTSVMIDASHYDFKKNVRLTKRVVDYAHEKNASVEAELGQLKGCEDGISSDKNIYTDPETAREFAEKTGVNSLAVAIGTSHGAYKFSGRAKLKFCVLKEIRKNVQIPLVLHGASSVYSKYVNKANKFGAKIENACGVGDATLKRAVKEGIQKVNTDTDLRLAYTAAVREFLHKNPDKFDPRKINSPAIEEMQKLVEHKIKILGSDRKA
ncbi:MAG: class II fructose-1,6-bisphosphate aldolase [Candidatus Nanoarchaeia archaeon]